MDRNHRPPLIGAPEARIQFGIQDMLNIHSYLSQLKKDTNISPELDSARTDLEQHIITFIQSLRTGPAQ